MTNSHNEIAINIVENNKYMVLATSNNYDPWIAPVMYWTDDNNNFYFVSHVDSRHIKYIMINPFVAVSIFDSNVPEGMGDKTGIQFSATAKLYLSNNEIIDALKASRQRFPHTSLDELKLRYETWCNNNRILCKIIPRNIYLNSYNGIDFRIQVTFTRRLCIIPFRSKL
jgi:uncharacterized protein YhbP (UPF0306 family)